MKQLIFALTLGLQLAWTLSASAEEYKITEGMELNLVSQKGGRFSFDASKYIKVKLIFDAGQTGIEEDDVQRVVIIGKKPGTVKFMEYIPEKTGFMGVGSTPAQEIEHSVTVISKEEYDSMGANAAGGGAPPAPALLKAKDKFGAGGYSEEQQKQIRAEVVMRLEGLLAAPGTQEITISGQKETERKFEYRITSVSRRDTSVSLDILDIDGINKLADLKIVFELHHGCRTNDVCRLGPLEPDVMEEIMDSKMFRFTVLIDISNKHFIVTHYLGQGALENLTIDKITNLIQEYVKLRPPKDSTIPAMLMRRQ